MDIPSVSPRCIYCDRELLPQNTTGECRRCFLLRKMQEREYDKQMIVSVKSQTEMIRTDINIDKQIKSLLEWIGDNSDREAIIVDQYVYRDIVIVATFRVQKGKCYRQRICYLQQEGFPRVAKSMTITTYYRFTDEDIEMPGVNILPLSHMDNEDRCRERVERAMRWIVDKSQDPESSS